MALNATIEAARAGRGFTIVANEITFLAAQTMRATQQTNDQISGK